MWADEDPWVGVHGLCLRVGLGFALAAVVGLVLDVG